MQKTILQVPVNKQLKDDAEKAAYAEGFSSLQEMLRVFMTKLANRKISLTFNNEVVQLSKRNEKKYLKITEDFTQKKNISEADSVDDLMEQLHKSL